MEYDSESCDYMDNDVCSNGSRSNENWEMNKDFLPMGREYEKNIQIIEILLTQIVLTEGNLEAIDENGDFSFLLAYNIADKSFFYTLLKLCDRKLKLMKQKKFRLLLGTIVKDCEWDILTEILEKCIIDSSDESFFVQLTLLILQQNEMSIFKRIILKYFPENYRLTNGESFLTNTMKMDLDEYLLVRMIRAGCFNVNERNEANETPLMLACYKLSVEVVEVLIRFNCNIQYDNSRAIDVIISVISNCDSEKLEKATKILKLLNNPSRVPVAMDDPQDVDSEYAHSSMMRNEQNAFPSPMKKIILDIITLLVLHGGNISKITQSGDSVISLAYNLLDKRIFEIVLGNHKRTWELATEFSVQSILTTMILNNEFELLKKILKKCAMTKSDDRFLLSLALLAIRQDQCEMCKFVVLKCANRNRLLNNNETFVTNLFLECVDSRILITVLEWQLFDLNVPNGAEETCLTLASERLLSDVVGTMLQCGSDVSFRNYRAVEVTALKGSDGCKENLEAKNQILDLFFRKTNSKNESFNESILPYCDEAVSDIQFSVLAKYQIKENLSRRNYRTNLLEMFLFALFAKSDYMDYLFFKNDSNSDINYNVRNMRYFLVHEIIYPLRKNGYINQRKIFTFFELIREYNGVPKENDFDLTEIVKLLSSLSEKTDLLSVQNLSGDIHETFYLSLEINLSVPQKSMCIQDLLNIYMTQQNKMFTKVPACLILEVPREKIHQNKFSCIIPTDCINISDMCVSHSKICNNCNEDAKFCCFECIESKIYNFKFGFRCNRDNCSHVKRKYLLSSKVSSKSQIKMNLQAIICNDNEYYMTILKDDSNKPKWLSFSSIDGPYIPTVTFDERISTYLCSSETMKKNSLFGKTPRYLRQLLNGSYLFVYSNSTMTCY